MNNAFTESRIGILGGGQLGRMLIQSAIDFNLNISILDPDPNAPCKSITDRFVCGKLTDFDTVYSFGSECDLITIEIENVNVDALDKLQKEGKNIYPQPDVIRLIQNKISQKNFYKSNGFPTAEFAVTENRDEVYRYSHWIPFVNKLATEGYDGRGVQIIKSSNDIQKSFDKQSIVEKFIDFETEISVVVARNAAGETAAFPAVELSFHPTANLVEYLYSPAAIPEEISEKAKDIAIRVIEKLEMVGLLAVEMFVTKEGNVLINEMAPRPHNSGHQTIEGNITSQFEQHLRAILNMPLGDTSTLIPSAMVNLLGEDGFIGPARYEGINEVLGSKGVHIHLYGKKITKPFRKMGHVTITNFDFAKLKEKAKFVKDTLKVKA